MKLILIIYIDQGRLYLKEKLYDHFWIYGKLSNIYFILQHNFYDNAYGLINFKILYENFSVFYYKLYD
jgi:hypothetical protein